MKKTRTFINQIRECSFLIESAGFDYYAMNSKMVNFAEKYNLSYRAINNIQHVIEESLQITGQDKGVLIKLSYSEKSTELILEISTPERLSDNILDSENNALSVAMIRGMSNSVELDNTASGSVLTVNIINNP